MQLRLRLLGRTVRCVRGGREVFSDLDFEVASGNTLAITGPNGAGKTSLLRLVAGLILPAGGSIELEGGGEDELTLADQAHYRGDGDTAQCLAAVGLDHAAHLPAAYLSAGQRRRLSIARLLAARRPVWLLDEPTSALDAAGQALFVGVINDHLARGGLVVAATHTPLGVAAKELRIGGGL
jgi:heme exporter protein A